VKQLEAKKIVCSEGT